MKNEDVAEWNEEALLMEEFEGALLGVVQRCGTPALATYSYKGIIKILMDRDKMDYSDAMEYIDYNILGAFMGENTPMILMDDYDDDDIELSEGKKETEN
jgi:hypothetical protein